MCGCNNMLICSVRGRTGSGCWESHSRSAAFCLPPHVRHPCENTGPLSSPTLQKCFVSCVLPLSTSLSRKQRQLFSFHFSFSTKRDVLFSIPPLISRIDVENNLGCNFSSGFSNFKVCHLNLETGVCSLAHTLSRLMHRSLRSWKHTVNMVSACLEETPTLAVNAWFPHLWSEAITPENGVMRCPGNVCSALWHLGSPLLLYTFAFCLNTCFQKLNWSISNSISWSGHFWSFS